MPKPRRNRKPGQPPVQTKTMFYTEGNPVASLVINRLGRHTEERLSFPTGEAALGWCREHGTNLFYMPVSIAAN